MLSSTEHEKSLITAGPNLMDTVIKTLNYANII